VVVPSQARPAPSSAPTTDIGAGHISLLIAACNRDVTALTRARLERVHRGEVEATGVNLGDGTRGKSETMSSPARTTSS